MSAHHFGLVGVTKRTFAAPTPCSDLKSDRNSFPQFLAQTRGDGSVEKVELLQDSRVCTRQKLKTKMWLGHLVERHERVIYSAPFAFLLQSLSLIFAIEFMFAPRQIDKNKFSADCFVQFGLFPRLKKNLEN